MEEGRWAKSRHGWHDIPLHSKVAPTRRAALSRRAPRFAPPHRTPGASMFRRLVSRRLPTNGSHPGQRYRDQDPAGREDQGQLMITDLSTYCRIYEYSSVGSRGVEGAQWPVLNNSRLEHSSSSSPWGRGARGRQNESSSSPRGRDDWSRDQPSLVSRQSSRDHL